MPSRIRSTRPRLTYANVMATVAVFLVLGGGAYATHTHRMGTEDLNNRIVTTQKLANNAVAPRTIRDGAVTNRKLGGLRALRASRTVPVPASAPNQPANERTVLRFGPNIEVAGRCRLTAGGQIEGLLMVHAFPGGTAERRMAVTGPSGGTIGNGGSTNVVENSAPVATQSHEAGEFAITITNTAQGQPRLRRGFTGAGGVALRIDGTNRCFFNASLIGG